MKLINSNYVPHFTQQVLNESVKTKAEPKDSLAVTGSVDPVHQKDNELSHKILKEAAAWSAFSFVDDSENQAAQLKLKMHALATDTIALFDLNELTELVHVPAEDVGWATNFEKQIDSGHRPTRKEKQKYVDIHDAVSFQYETKLFIAKTSVALKSGHYYQPSAEDLSAYIETKNKLIEKRNDSLGFIDKINRLGNSVLSTIEDAVQSIP